LLIILNFVKLSLIMPKISPSGAKPIIQSFSSNGNRYRVITFKFKMQKLIVYFSTVNNVINNCKKLQRSASNNIKNVQIIKSRKTRPKSLIRKLRNMNTQTSLTLFKILSYNYLLKFSYKNT